MTTGADTPVTAEPAPVPDGEGGGRRRPPPARGPRSFVAGLAVPLGLQVLAFVLSTALTLAVLAALGYDVGAVLGALVDGSLGSAYAVSLSLTQAAPVVLASTAVWLAYQAGLFNIGSDGQLQVGGLTALVVCLALPDGTAGMLMIVAALVAAIAAGAAWAAVAGLLRAYRGANEVISTIMLNFIASTAIGLLIAGVLRSPQARYSPRTDRIPPSSQLGDVFPGVPVVFVVALVISVLTLVAVRRTSLGLRLRTVGLNGDAAEHAGLRVRALQWQSFALSGGLAGLAGGLVVLGYRYAIAPGWASPWGLLGIVIAFLAMRTPALIPVWAVVLGIVGAAGPGLKGAASVPDSVITVLQGLPVVVLFLIVALGRSAWLRRFRVFAPHRKVT